MRKQMSLLISLALLCLLANVVSAELISYWPLNEGEGTSVADVTGNWPGTITGDVTWTTGYEGSALEFPGGVDYVNFGQVQYDGSLSLSYWCFNPIQGNEKPIGQHAGNYSTEPGWAVFSRSDGGVWFRVHGANTAWDGGDIQITDSLSTTEWYHLTFTFDGLTRELKGYLNGTMKTQTICEDGRSVSPNSNDLRFGHVGTGAPFSGMLDEVALYDHVLNGAEIQRIFNKGISLGGNTRFPSPEDGDNDVPLGTQLRWSPGDFATEHDVYFGMSFDDVNSATPTSSAFQKTLPLEKTRFDPGKLDYGVTYYWRIDEVNDLNPDSPWKGDVWSFIAEPEVVDLEAEKITIFPSSVGSDSLGNPLDVNNVINGAGLVKDLDPNGLHDTDIANMWKAAAFDVDPDPSIEFVFDKPYRLADMRVWNHNSVDELSNDGYSIKDVTVSYLDGTEWIVLADITQFAQAPGTPDYAGELFPLNIVASGIRIEAESPYATITIPGYGTYPIPQYGLSEVGFRFIPNAVRKMSPADGAVDVNPATAELSWRAGREAVSHNVYLSTDEQSVIDRTAGMTSRIEPNMIPEIDLSQTYYWCVDEVNELANPSVWTGPVQSFTTADYLVIEDFDAYSDDWGNMVFQSWTDGLGWEDPAGNTGPSNGSGSGVGHWPPPTMERTIARNGKSMPFAYGLEGRTDSYASADMSNLDGPDDWSKHGIQSLSLWIYGDIDNVGGQLYVKVNGKRYDYPGSSTDIQTAQWFPFTVNLTGITQVNSLTIGVQGGSGLIYVDDIRLYSASVENESQIE